MCCTEYKHHCKSNFLCYNWEHRQNDALIKLLLFLKVNGKNVLLTSQSLGFLVVNTRSKYFQNNQRKLFDLKIQIELFKSECLMHKAEALMDVIQRRKCGISCSISTGAATQSWYNLTQTTHFFRDALL